MSNWSLNRWIVLLLLGGYVVLVLDIRSEHQAVLARHEIAWTPIVYSIAAIVLGLVALAFWNSWGRAVLFWIFTIGLVVGVLGFWQHNEEHFGQRLAYVFSVWATKPPERRRPANVEGNAATNGGERSEAGTSANQSEPDDGNAELKAPILPPVFAPLSFVGLGAIGMLVTLRLFQYPRAGGERL